MALLLFSLSGLMIRGDPGRFAPIFHVSPARCGLGWTNDPNGPFELNGVHHIFYQYSPNNGGQGPGPGHRKISWGHVAGNLSHMRCLPPAIRPGVDGDGAPTDYDSSGILLVASMRVLSAPLRPRPHHHPAQT